MMLCSFRVAQTYRKIFFSTDIYECSKIVKYFISIINFSLFFYVSQSSFVNKKF